MAGALGVALGSMVANFTAGKQAYAVHEADIQRILEHAEAIRCRLLDLVNEDAAAFLPLSQAYAIPKDNPQREHFMRFATLRACVAPEGVLDTCCAVVRLLSISTVL